MNKIYKYLLIGLATFSIFFACFSSASNLHFTENYYFKTGHLNLTNADIVQLYDFQNNPNNVQYTSLDSVCIIISAITGFTNSTNANSSIQCGINQINYISNRLNLYYNVNSQIACFPLHSLSNYNRLNCKATSNNYISGSVDFDYGLFLLSSLLSSGGGDCPSCPDQYTSLECQSEYNLIPISEVTANYCRLNFDLIDPQECPINEGTGAIVRSNLMINEVPYAQNQNINVFIPDFLAWNISFNDLYTVIDVEGYNADEEYINNVINQEKLTPTNEDFANLINGLIAFIPYLFIGLLFLRLVKIINKIWK